MGCLIHVNISICELKSNTLRFYVVEKQVRNIPNSPMPAIAVTAIPCRAEVASQVIAKRLLASFVLIDVDVPECPNRSILQMALLIAGTLKS